MAISLELVRREVHARYTLSRLGPGQALVDLTLAGPLNTLPAPTAAEKAAWQPTKRRYVQQANATCAHLLSRLRGPSQLASALTRTYGSLAALPPPAGERKKVEAFLAPLRLIAQAARAAQHADGEAALPSAVALAGYTTSFNKAASRYGLKQCVLA
jgi:hypothetical protein